MTIWFDLVQPGLPSRHLNGGGKGGFENDGNVLVRRNGSKLIETFFETKDITRKKLPFGNKNLDYPCLQELHLIADHFLLL